ncbi:MAG TPA: YciI family protein [Actinomycetota bacterium]|nr:YciI family protein [Actinomycetota bacterium]
MKYLIALFGDQATMVETKSTEWIKDMIRFMGELDHELADSGERVDSVGLVDPTQAKTVRFVQGAPVATDGPFAEAKESLAGYYLVDVESEARALEIASKIVGHIHEPVEVRQLADAPPEEFTS